MSRIANSLTVPKGMYRHFTVITLVATGCVAIFADGERRQAINDEVSAQNQKAALRSAEAEKNGAANAGQHEVRYAPRGSWGSDGVVDTDPLVSAEGGGYSVSGEGGGQRIAGGGDYGMIGTFTQAEISNGKFPLTKTGPKQRVSSVKPATAEQRKAFESAMSARAGAPTPAN